MIRVAVALLVAAVCAPPVGAQPGNLPLAPGVHPASPIGPGTQFLPQPRPQFVPSPVFGVGGAKPPRRFPQLGYGFNAPFVGFGPVFPYFPYYAYNDPYAVPPIVIEIVPPGPPQPPEPKVILANVFPAALTVQFPAAARVWLDGKEVAGGPHEEHTFTSAPLPRGTAHAFAFKARWTAGGKTYEAERKLNVAAGDSSRLTVVLGTEVRE